MTLAAKNNTKTLEAQGTNAGQPTGIIYESFATFFQNPTKTTLRELLRQNVGELNGIDFKAAWPEDPVLAKHLLALGNHGGGCMVIGVEEQSDGSFSPIGIPEVKDAATVMQKIRKFLPDSLLVSVTVLPFVYKDSEYETLKGKAFQVVFVQADFTHAPYVSEAEGNGIKNATVYVRRGTASEAADHDELQKIINNRIATKHSTAKEISLSDHLEQLKLLYKELPRTLTTMSPGVWSGLESIRSLVTLGGSLQSVDNPHYPKQGYDEFLADCIRRKKHKIEDELDI